MTVMSPVNELSQPLKFDMKINGKEMPPISTLDFFQYSNETVGSPSYSAISLNRYDNSLRGISINSYADKGTDSFSYISMPLARYIVEIDDSYDSIDQLLGEIYEITIEGVPSSFTINNFFDVSYESIIDKRGIHSELIIDDLFGEYCIITNYSKMYFDNLNVLFSSVSAHKDYISAMINSQKSVSSLENPFKTYFLNSDRTKIKDSLLEEYCLLASFESASIFDNPYNVLYIVLSIISIFAHIGISIISLAKHKIRNKHFAFLMISLLLFYLLSSLVLYISIGNSLSFILYNNLFFACVGLLLPCIIAAVTSGFSGKASGDSIFV
jgi:hypothetical protein